MKLLTYLLGLALLGSILTNCTTHNRLQAARLELAQTREQYAEAARLAEASHRAAERTHAAEIQTITQKADHEKQTLAATVDRLSRSLRDRPDRPTGGAVPAPAAGPVACTGAQLYRPDGEFLVGEAARADRLRVQLAECQARYDAAVKLTNTETSQ